MRDSHRVATLTRMLSRSGLAICLLVASPAFADCPKPSGTVADHARTLHDAGCFSGVFLVTRAGKTLISSALSRSMNR